MESDDPIKWSPDQVRNQICASVSALRDSLQIKPILNLQTLEKALQDNDIDGENLLILEDANIKEDLGISSFGQRREIRKIIQHLRSISPAYKAINVRIQKRRLSSQEEEPESTPDSKKRRISSLSERAAVSFPRLRTEPQKRRIQPLNLSSVPLTMPASSLPQPQFANPIILPSNAANDPEKFDPANLSDEWQDFLERYREDPDEPVLRPYNETDSEKELDSDGDASLLAELESEDLPTPSRISAEEIEAAIDETLEGFKTSWNSHKQSKKHKTAHRRWMQAAKARTRRPQQNALQKELSVLQNRLAKFRQSIADTSMDYHKVSEVKRNCLNLQATVEDIAEKEYYLEILTSDHPPARPEPSSHPPAVEEKLSPGEELLDSSEDSEELESEHSDSVSDMPLASDDESTLTLPYDPADNEWNPILPTAETEQSTDDESREEPVEITDLTQEVMARGTPQTIEFPDLELLNEVSDDEGSDLDRLPRNRYRDVGNSRDTAISLGSSPIRSSSNDQTNLTDISVRTPPLNPTPSANIKRETTTTMRFPPIQELRAKLWREIKDNADLILCKMIYRTDRAQIRSVLQFIEPLTTAMIPDRLVAGLNLIQDISDEGIEDNNARPDPFIAWTFFFLVYAHARGFRDVWSVSEARLDEAFSMIQSKALPFDKLLRPLMRWYTETETSGGPQSSLLSRPKMKKSLTNHRDDVVEVTSNQMGRQSASYLRQSTPPSINIYTDTETEVDEEPSSSKKRKRHVAQSQEALSQQRDDRYRVQEQERRRQMMLAKFQSQEAIGEARNVIVNSVEEVPILLDQHIARKIKPHQESGVQFIWRELVEDKKHQGCLLAHTMGLGKTMQVISFLVTLAQCNASERPEVRNLVPKKLRSGRVLILCPASLVENWYDELMMWTPPTLPGERGLLGTIYKISGDRNLKIKTIRDWQKWTPGVLIIGYESLRSLLKNKNHSEDDKKYLENALLQDPCVVIGDEAHKMKNSKSVINKLAQTFKTTSRIALTGSPLNNHLEEYHTMIDWIAPGYLGTLVQFKAKYSEPIERGLFAESTRYEKRKSLERLYVLKRDLAPKIDRRDISAIASDMPQKTEFFITVPLTELQKGMYSLLIKRLLAGLSSQGAPKRSTNAQLWSWLAILSWLCNHPTILTQKLQNQDKNGASAGVDNEDEEDEGAPANVDIAKYPIAALLPDFLELYARFDETGDIYNAELSTRALVTQLLIQESVNKGERILLFSHSIPTLNYLQGLLDDLQYKYMRIDGSTRTDQRQAACKEFNDDNSDYMVFLISTRAGGLGLNLQGATRVIIYDFGFNPSWEEQAIGRAYRLGQKKPVFVYRFRAGGTFEDAMYNKSIFKTQLFSRVVDQKNVIRHTSRDIKDYLFEPREAEQNDLSECLGKDELLDKVNEMIPGAIRDLILTETFQREDEDDELTAEEKKLADAEVEMERLQRANPAEYALKLAERLRAQRAAPVPQVTTTSAYFPLTQFAGGYTHEMFRDPATAGDVIVRNSDQAARDCMEVSIEKIAEVTTPSSDNQSKPPGCEPQ